MKRVIHAEPGAILDITSFNNGPDTPIEPDVGFSFRKVAESDLFSELLDRSGKLTEGYRMEIIEHLRNSGALSEGATAALGNLLHSSIVSSRSSNVVTAKVLKPTTGHFAVTGANLYRETRVELVSDEPIEDNPKGGSDYVIERLLEAGSPENMAGAVAAEVDLDVCRFDLTDTKVRREAIRLLVEEHSQQALEILRDYAASLTASLHSHTESLERSKEAIREALIQALAAEAAKVGTTAAEIVKPEIVGSILSHFRSFLDFDEDSISDLNEELELIGDSVRMLDDPIADEIILKNLPKQSVATMFRSNLTPSRREAVLGLALETIDQSWKSGRLSKNDRNFLKEVGFFYGSPTVEQLAEVKAALSYQTLERELASDREGALTRAALAVDLISAAKVGYLVEVISENFQILSQKESTSGYPLIALYLSGLSRGAQMSAEIKPVSDALIETAYTFIRANAYADQEAWRSLVSVIDTHRPDRALELLSEIYADTDLSIPVRGNALLAISNLGSSESDKYVFSQTGSTTWLSVLGAATRVVRSIVGGDIADRVGVFNLSDTLLGYRLKSLFSVLGDQGHRTSVPIKSDPLFS